jgi:hypothetical protein
LSSEKKIVSLFQNKRVLNSVPLSRQNSGFTLLFERVVMSLVGEMPVSAVARHVGTTDNRLWRIIRHYVAEAMNHLDLSGLCGLGLDETASRRGHDYVTVFTDMDREDRPVIFATPGKGKECLRRFVRFLEEHGGHPDTVMEVVRDSPSFLAASSEEFPHAAQDGGWWSKTACLDLWSKRSKLSKSICPES